MILLTCPRTWHLLIRESSIYLLVINLLLLLIHKFSHGVTAIHPFKRYTLLVWTIADGVQLEFHHLHPSLVPAATEMETMSVGLRASQHLPRLPKEEEILPLKRL